MAPHSSEKCLRRRAYHAATRRRMAYLQEGVAAITSAIASEGRGEWQLAFDEYVRGIGRLLNGASGDSDPVWTAGAS